MKIEGRCWIKSTGEVIMDWAELERPTFFRDEPDGVLVFLGPAIKRVIAEEVAYAIRIDGAFRLDGAMKMIVKKGETLQISYHLKLNNFERGKDFVEYQ